MLTALVLVNLGSARAQLDSPMDDDPTVRMVFTEKAGFVTGLRQLVCAGEAKVYPDPRGHYVLVSQFIGEQTGDGILTHPDPTRGTSRLLLYNSRTGRTKVLWEDAAVNMPGGLGADEINQVAWLADSDSALVSLRKPVADAKPGSGPPTEYEFSMLRIRATSETPVYPLIGRRAYLTAIYPSPSVSTAVVGVFTSVKSPEGTGYLSRKFYTIDDRGVESPTLNLGPIVNCSNLWSDGATTYFLEHDLAEWLKEMPREKRQRKYYRFNVQTQALTVIPEYPVIPPAPASTDANPLRLVSGPLSALPPDTAHAAGTKPKQIAPLWLTRADTKLEGRLPCAALVAPDAQSSALMADDSAVLYVADGSVYAVPLFSQPRRDADAGLRKILQKKTVARANAIYATIIEFSNANGGMLPSGTNLITKLSQYSEDPSIFNNPETETPGLTNVMTGQARSSTYPTATTVLGYLAGPGGRAVIYGQGDVKWEDPD